MSTQQAPPKKTGLSLYADLLGGPQADTGSVISGAPVRYAAVPPGEDGNAETKKKNDGILRIQIRDEIG